MSARLRVKRGRRHERYKNRHDCDIPACAGHPGMPDGWTHWAKALHRDDNFESFFAWHTTEPVIRAESLGHAVEFDPPAAMTKARRWTCTTCGRAVLIYDHNIYGGAVEKRCARRAES